MHRVIMAQTLVEWSTMSEPIDIDQIHEDDQNLDRASRGESTGDPVVDALREHFDRRAQDS